jgi:hypothetical protein
MVIDPRSSADPNRFAARSRISLPDGKIWEKIEFRLKSDWPHHDNPF